MRNDLVLVREVTRFTELRRRLIEADPEIDETTLLDTLEGATNLTEAIGEVILDALKTGSRVPGATFTNSRVSLAIRTK